MHSKEIDANYIKIEQKRIKISNISIENIFGKKPTQKDTFFAFESIFTPFQQYIIGNVPRTDLVIQDNLGKCYSGLEIKLTALPDHTTCDLEDSRFGSEIVVRPDTIVYLACNIASSLNKDLSKYIKPISVSDWSEPSQVLPHLPEITKSIKSLSLESEAQQPILIQPIWKTEGKSPKLAHNCLDVFVWSSTAFTYFISDISSPNSSTINRHSRTVIWLYKMLLDIAQNGKFNPKSIIDTMTYNTKNDKAFASSGNVTNEYMKSPRLENPIIKKTEIKNIILGGGQNLLSPERRFDAIIYNSPEIFS